MNADQEISGDKYRAFEKDDSERAGGGIGSILDYLKQPFVIDIRTTCRGKAVNLAVLKGFLLPDDLAGLEMPPEIQISNLKKTSEQDDGGDGTKKE